MLHCDTASLLNHFKIYYKPYLYRLFSFLLSLTVINELPLFHLQGPKVKPNCTGRQCSLALVEWQHVKKYAWTQKHEQQSDFRADSEGKKFPNKGDCKFKCDRNFFTDPSEQLL